MNAHVASTPGLSTLLRYGYEFSICVCRPVTILDYLEKLKLIILISVPYWVLACSLARAATCAAEVFSHPFKNRHLLLYY